MRMFGGCSSNYLITFLSQQSCRIKYSACTVVSVPVLIHSIKEKPLTGNRKCHTRDLFAICCGPILTIGWGGASVLEVLATPLVKISPSNSTKQMAYN